MTKMTTALSPTRILVAIAAAVLCAIAPLQAQDDIVGLYDGVIQASNAGNLDKGINLCDKAIKEYSQGAMQKYGPVFGHFFYMKGMLLIRKENYAAAIGPLKICYEKWDNSYLKKVPPTDDNPLLPNRFHIHSMMQWGNCLMKMENYAEAAKKFEKTLAEDPQTEPRISRLVVSINLARCYILSEQRDKGQKFLSKMLESDLSPEAKQQIFMILAWDWSPEAPFAKMRDEITKHAEVTTDDTLYYRYERNKRFESLAGHAFQIGEPIRALIWYSLMAPPGEMVGLYEDRKVQLQAQREMAVKEEKAELISRADTLIAETDKEIAAKRSDWARLLLGTGAAHYQLSSVAAARAAYYELAQKFPKHPERATILHNLVVCNVNMERWLEAYEYGITFFKEFPNHELKPSVARVLVEVIYLQGEYQEAYDIATEVRPEMPEGSAIREIPEFVVGATAFHLSKFQQAEQELENYLKVYPDGRRLEMVRFYLGNTKVNLLKWDEAAVILESFLKDYPDSLMRPSVLFLAGLSHLVLEDLDLAHQRIQELQQKHPSAEEIPASHNVMGDILAAQEAAYDPIRVQYLTAKDYVEEKGRGSIDVAAYALRQLVAAAAEAEEWQASSDYYDEFKERYWETSYQLDASLSVLDPLVELGRREEGVEMLVRFVNEKAGAGVSNELDLLFGAYLDFLDKNFTNEEKLEKLANYPFVDPNNPPGALDAWLVMAQIETLEGSEKPKENEEDINKLFFRLEALYERDGKNLSNYTLVRLARWIWEVHGREAEARDVYEFIVNERGDATGDAMGFALVDLGKLELQSEVPQKWRAAYEKFDKVLRQVENPQLREEATLNSARVLMKEKNWEEADVKWKEYLSNRSWNMARAEANFSRAKCLDEQDQDAEALKVYVSVYVNYAGHLDWSTEAYMRSGEILRSQGRETDALRVMQEMLQRMGHLEHPGIEKGKATFFKWRDEYVAKNPN